jgi:hypothetical protein
MFKLRRLTSGLMFCCKTKEVIIVGVEVVLSLYFVLVFVVILIFRYRFLGVCRFWFVFLNTSGNCAYHIFNIISYSSPSPHFSSFLSHHAHSKFKKNVNHRPLKLLFFVIWQLDFTYCLCDLQASKYSRMPV